MKVIQCPHESGEVADFRQEAPDHHPLTREEIATLLEEAKTAKEPIISLIQIRLCQGIPGYVCPRHIDGPVAEKETEIDELYVRNYRRGADPAIVQQLYQIMVR